MDDYHKFMHAHENLIKEWQLYQSTIYIFITKGIVTPSGTMVTLCINLASGSRNTNGSGAIRNGGITRNARITGGWWCKAIH